MEDWQKYIFDPKNPKGFKAYNLLKKIIKEGNTLLLTDMYYFNELYKNEIWTKDVIDELWDKPDDFEELSSNKKVKVYIENFSESSYLELLEKKVNKLDKLKQNRLFSKLSVDLKEHWKEYDDFPDAYLHHYSLEPLSSLFISKIKEFDESQHFLLNQKCFQNNNNCFIFLDGNDNVALDDFLSNLVLKKLSVFFTDELMFEILDLNKKKFKNLHPIILQDIEDIHQLLDFLVRDLEQDNQPNNSHQPDVYLDEVDIDNYFFLEDIKIKNLKDKREIYLMGENGDGKTILLQAITLALRGNQNIGDVIDIVKQDKTPKTSLVAKTSDKKTYKY